MTPDEFLDWIQAQDQRYELVDGVPVAMAGAKRRHDQIVVNALAELRNQLRGGPCRPFSADTAVRISTGNIRFPDAGVDCGRFDDEATFAPAPAVVIEVLSASTRDFDLFGKLEEYKTIPALRHIMLVNPDDPQIIHWSRAEEGEWGYRIIEGLESALEFPDLGLRLALADLYEGLQFRIGPRLVADEA
ncbi:MAG: Uma2 family endonuclease [Acetobacteraceae bacterium]|nr:Uma2 family endonuclease [Acetobacteraceae bacterium]